MGVMLIVKNKTSIRIYSGFPNLTRLVSFAAAFEQTAQNDIVDGPDQ